MPGSETMAQFVARSATRELLLLVRAELHERLAPDGYTLG
jgi:hypothetical protein